MFPIMSLIRCPADLARSPIVAVLLAMPSLDSTADDTASVADSAAPAMLDMLGAIDSDAPERPEKVLGSTGFSLFSFSSASAIRLTLSIASSVMADIELVSGLRSGTLISPTLESLVNAFAVSCRLFIDAPAVALLTASPNLCMEDAA